MIKRLYNLFRDKLNKILLKNKRSPDWAKLEKQFLSKNPNCQICKSTQRLNVHHKKPFHLFPDLELDENNLITLCMSV